MTQKPLPDDVQRFLTGEIVSVERLDVLLFLHRHTTRWWTAEKVADELEMPAEAVHSHLEHLSTRNLLDVRIADSMLFCYKPAREDLSRLVEDLAEAHYRRRDTVVRVLTGQPADGARLFAEAFHFRKGKKDG